MNITPNIFLFHVHKEAMAAAVRAFDEDWPEAKISNILEAISQQGLTCVLTLIYWKENKIKCDIAIGKGKILENGDVRPLDVKVGDTILFGKYSGTEVSVDGEELLVMREDDITAIVG